MANRPIAVSLKSRGLAVFDKPPFAPGWLAEVRQNVVAQTIDLAIAIATNVVLLNWSTWFSVILTILSICFYGFFQGGRVARADGSLMIPITFLIYLPALWLAHTASSRRLEAARHLEAVQSHVVGMYVLHTGLSNCGAPQQLAELDDAINDTMVQLQGYLAHHRPLSTTHFCPTTLRAENLPVNSGLFVLGRDIGQRLRRLHSCQRRMSAAVSALLEHCSSSSRAGQHSSQQALALLHLLVPLSSAIGRLVCLKEARSPLLLRAMLRASCVVLAPLMTGSWLAGLAGQPAGAVGMVFAIVIGSILQVLLMSVLTLALLLEDPFDTGPAAAPDTISLLEFNHTLSYLTSPPNAEDDPPEQDDPSAEQHVQQKYHHQIQGFVLQQQQQAGPREPSVLDAAGEPAVAHTAVTMTVSAPAGGGASSCAAEAAVGDHSYEYGTPTVAAAAADGHTWEYAGSAAAGVAAEGVAPMNRAARGNQHVTRQRAPSPTTFVQPS